MAMREIADEHRDLVIVEGDQKIPDFRVPSRDPQLASIILKRNTRGHEATCQ